MSSPTNARYSEAAYRDLHSTWRALEQNIAELERHAMRTEGPGMARLAGGTMGLAQKLFRQADQTAQTLLLAVEKETAASAGQSTPDQTEPDSPQKAPREFAHQTYAVEISIPRKWIEDWLQSVLPDRYSHEDLEKFRASELEELLRKVLP